MTIHRSRHFCVFAVIASGASELDIMEQTRQEAIQTTDQTCSHLFPARRDAPKRHLDDICGAKPEDPMGLNWGWGPAAVITLPARASGKRS